MAKCLWHVKKKIRRNEKRENVYEVDILSSKREFVNTRCHFSVTALDVNAVNATNKKFIFNPM